MSVAERWRDYQYVARIMFWGRRDLLDDLYGVLRYAAGGFNRD
jgi:hypothetical protein